MYFKFVLIGIFLLIKYFIGNLLETAVFVVEEKENSINPISPMRKHVYLKK